MKIAIAVHGRFHAFDLALALINAGHQVVVFTNYPKWATSRFGLPPHAVRTLWLHGILVRVNSWFHERLRLPFAERTWHVMFGRWVASQLRNDSWDVVHLWSGIAEETLKTVTSSDALRILMRGSSHIRTQTRLLQEESDRCGVSVPCPSQWMIAREEKEYDASDAILVLSSFSVNSFVEEGIPASKLWLIPASASPAKFGARPESIDNRCHRIASGERLRILYVGTLSFQKGLMDLAAIIHQLKDANVRFRLVGHATREAGPILGGLKDHAEIWPHQPQHQLRSIYDWGDLFIYPTIQDGFAIVLAHAQTNGLPILATTSCGAPELVQDGKTGWLFQPRDAEGFVAQLLWCDRNRAVVADMARTVAQVGVRWTWSDAAHEFVRLSAMNGARRRAIPTSILQFSVHHS